MVAVDKLTITLEDGQTFEVSVQEAKALMRDLANIIKSLQIKPEPEKE
jgi:hypothetical protein